MIKAEDTAWSIEGYCSGLGTYRLYGRKPAQLLFTENESNSEKLWGQPNKSPFVKDAFHRAVIEGEQQAVNPAKQGSKSSAWHQLVIEPGAEEIIDLVLTNEQTVLTQAGLRSNIQATASGSGSILPKSIACQFITGRSAYLSSGDGRHDLEQTVLPF